MIEHVGIDLDDLFDEVEEIMYAEPRGQEAERLEAAAEGLAVGEPPRAECLRSAVDWWQQRGRHDDALRCAEAAIADGGPTWVDARASLLSVLLVTGEARADELEKELRRDLGQCPNVDVMIEMTAEDLENAGRLRAAARWYTLALADADPDEVPGDGGLERLVARRYGVRRMLGLPVDRYDVIAQSQDDGRLLRRTAPDFAGTSRTGVLLTVLHWPPDEFRAFVERWPELAEGYGGTPEEHRAETERHLREFAEQHSNLLVAHGSLADFLAFSERGGTDPRTGEARAHYAAELGRTGRGTPWPPAAHDDCWCGSGHSYQTCCATVE
jgi:hypothetical protein